MKSACIASRLLVSVLPSALVDASEKEGIWALQAGLYC
jgi:hypothetical protein